MVNDPVVMVRLILVMRVAGVVMMVVRVDQITMPVLMVMSNVGAMGMGGFVAVGMRHQPRRAQDCQGDENRQQGRRIEPPFAHVEEHMQHCRP